MFQRTAIAEARNGQLAPCQSIEDVSQAPDHGLGLMVPDHAHAEPAAFGELQQVACMVAGMSVVVQFQLQDAMRRCAAVSVTLEMRCAQFSGETPERRAAPGADEPDAFGAPTGGAAPGEEPPSETESLVAMDILEFRAWAAAHTDQARALIEAGKTPIKLAMDARSGIMVSPTLHRPAFKQMCSDYPLYRAVSDLDPYAERINVPLLKKALASQYNEENWVGEGDYGDGQYYVTRRNILYSTARVKHLAKGWIFQSKLRIQARVVDFADITNPEMYEDPPDEIWDAFGRDESFKALWHWFDAVHHSQNQFMIVLNKRAVVVNIDTMFDNAEMHWIKEWVEDNAVALRQHAAERYAKAEAVRAKMGARIQQRRDAGKKIPNTLLRRRRDCADAVEQMRIEFEELTPGKLLARKLSEFFWEME